MYHRSSGKNIKFYGISCEKVDVSSLFKGRKDKKFAFWLWSQGAPSTFE
jgi:hypothetical protein